MLQPPAELPCRLLIVIEQLYLSAIGKIAQGGVSGRLWLTSQASSRNGGRQEAENQKSGGGVARARAGAQKGFSLRTHLATRLYWRSSFS